MVGVAVMDADRQPIHVATDSRAVMPVILAFDQRNTVATVRLVNAWNPPQQLSFMPIHPAFRTNPPARSIP